MSNAPFIGHHFVELASVDSTNNYAMARINEGAATHGSTYLSSLQTAGKGQRGRAWQAGQGMSILLSTVLLPHIPLSSQFMLSATVALGCRDFFQHYAGDETKIKWSNDIYWRDRKAGGILIENVLRGNRWSHAIVGIGININQEQFPPELPNPVSLRQITGQLRECRLLAKELCTCLEQRYQQLQPAHFSQIIQDYNDALYHLNEPAQYKMNETVFEGTIREVEADGKLLLQKGNMLLRLNFGEVEFIIN